MAQYEWYADVFWLTGFLTDFTVFLAASVLERQRIRPGRCMIAAALSALAETLLFVFMSRWYVYRAVVLFVADPCIAFFLYRPSGMRSLCRIWVTISGILLFTGGVQTCILQLFPKAAGSMVFLVSAAILSAGVVCMGKIRGIYQRQICEAELFIKDARVTLKAFCDTGNMLMDPYTGSPVSIAAAQSVSSLDFHKKVSVRLIPFRTIGTENSLMPVITVDKMNIYLPGRKLEVAHPVIGLKEGKLTGRNDVQMILNSALLTDRKK